MFMSISERVAKSAKLCDFPVIHIEQFAEFPIKSPIKGLQQILLFDKVKQGWLFKRYLDNPDMPKEVIRQFRQDDCDSVLHEGFVYVRLLSQAGYVYQRSPEISNIVRQARDHPFVCDNFRYITDNQGRDLVTWDLIKRLGDSARWPFAVIDDHVLHLLLIEGGIDKNSKIESIMLGEFNNNAIKQVYELARFYYRDASFFEHWL